MYKHVGVMLQLKCILCNEHMNGDNTMGDKWEGISPHLMNEHIIMRETHCMGNGRRATMRHPLTKMEDCKRKHLNR